MKHTIIVDIDRMLEIASLLDKAGFMKSYRVYNYAISNSGKVISGMDMKPKAYKYYLANCK